MKKLFISITVLFLATQAFCQVANSYNEQVLLNIDRTLYITGEHINFSAVLLSNDSPLSEILYVELITSSGKQIFGGKYKIEDSKSSGIIPISEDLISGNYYVRAYTKFMRNYGPLSYGYQYIKIINPYKDDLLNGKNINDTSQIILNPVNITQDLFNIEINKNSYKTREDIDVKISTNQNDSLLNITISVCPYGTTNFKHFNSIQTSTSSKQYMPETRGISLTGILKNRNTNELLSRKKVNLSILENNKNSFFSTFTTTTGHFYFALPDLYGKKDIFLSPGNIENTDAELLVDNDFCAEPVNLPDPDFSLTQKEQIAAYNLAVNKKVEDKFANDTISVHSHNNHINKDTLPFYGLPTSTLVLDDYINLPTLEDYFTEIPFLVKIRKIKGEKHFKILGTHPELQIYDPLIMVDLVPINSIEHILEVPPKNVKRIEVVTDPYVKGDVTYGGIINIISVNNDLAGIKLPDSGMFFNYLFLSKDQNVITTSPSDNIPDARNNLFWVPKMNLNKDKTLEFNFKTADSTGKYIILITGIKTNGERVYSSKTFEVK